MPDLLPTTLSLNGVRYDYDGLKRLISNNANSGNPLIEKLYQFLGEWLNDDAQITLKTSGSTGPPKIISIEKQRMVHSARMTGNFFGLKAGMKALLCLSPEYIGGKMQVVRAMEIGLDLIVTTLEANPLSSLNQMVDFASMVPLQVAQVLKQEPEKFGLMKTLIIGGGALPPALEQNLCQVPTACWHTYAMTETLSHVALRAVNGPGKSQWFTPMPGVELSVDARGCLIVKAPAVATDLVITNDLVEMNGPQFRVLGRIDDVIISAGHKLHPELIEQKLGSLISTPFFLAGETHPEAGQILVLYLEGIFNYQQTSDLEARIKFLLEAAEVPRKVVVVPAFKYLESGKIDRRNSVAANC